ncbi:copper chaperone PCu(A)C [Neotabrizicola sp. VNH66]|uniref:copper chaperone PCu(A)C n=1 Tax=Neotabrizicola sp. VNH66 TaxID=3400918 RepID=UPI003C0E0006
MSVFRNLLAAATAALTLTTAALAHDGHSHGAEAIHVTDPYARSSNAVSGAVFMVLHNMTDTDDRLIAVRSDVAERVELHTNAMNDAGVMTMTEVKEGFPVPAGGEHALARGGDHVMMMGLKAPLVEGATFPLTLVFEKAGEITVEVPVDNARKPDAAATDGMEGMEGMEGMDHSGHTGHGG